MDCRSPAQDPRRRRTRAELTQRAARGLPASLLSALLLVASAAAEPGAHLQDALRLEAEARAIESAGGDAPALWRATAKAFEAHASTDPAGPGYWRAARARVLSGDNLPFDAKDERIGIFAEATELAQRGLEANEECAECMLWKAIALGQLSASQGLWAGARNASKIARLLGRGIELEPTYADNEHNSVLANLHYASAVIYRMAPEWWIVRLLIGMRGDKERALRHIQAALARHPKRLDYQVEHGALLLCIGSSKNQPDRLAEGRAVLERSLRVETLALDERREKQAAQIMLDAPEKACDYAGDTWLDIETDDLRRGR